MSQESSEKVDADSSLGSTNNLMSASNFDESDFIELSDIVPAEHKVYIPQLLEEIQDDILLGQDLIDAATSKSFAEIPDSAAKSRELHINNISNSSDMILQQPVDSTILQDDIPVKPKKRRGRPSKSAQNCVETSTSNDSNNKSKSKRGRWSRNSLIDNNVVTRSTRPRRSVRDVTNNSTHDTILTDSVTNDVQSIISNDVENNEDIKNDDLSLSTSKNVINESMNSEIDLKTLDESILACCIEKKNPPNKIEKKNKISQKRKRGVKKGKAKLESVNHDITETTAYDNKDDEDDNIILSKFKNNILSTSDAGDKETHINLNNEKNIHNLLIDAPVKDETVDNIQENDKSIVDTSLLLEISSNSNDKKKQKLINDFDQKEITPMANVPLVDVPAVDEPNNQPKKDKTIEDSSLLLENSSKNRGRKKKKLMTDFEYDIDGVIARNLEQEQPLLSEDGRPLRRKARQKHYEEESDEDPFANIETDSENDDNNKKSKYYSDGEYIPGDLRKSTSVSELEDLDEDLEEYPKKKRSPRKQDSRKNKGSKNVDGPIVRTVTADSILIDDDIENCIQTSIIELKNKMIGTSLQIKKVSSQDSNKSTPLDIPMIDTTIVKNVDMSTQTTKIETLPACVQTSAPYDLKIKETVTFSKEQSQNACVFISNVLNATSELGVLMQQKSNEFIEKKINTTCIKDNTKVDYCIKKAYLLFKLAKDNLTNMEESLGKQYEQFLQSNNLMSSYITENKITPSLPKPSGSDSDCEIVEEPIVAKKVKNYQKTVILNKELSIKIAKKTPTEIPCLTNNKQKINLKGAHSVWINESIKIKKVKPQQSFLAQDSRYKKPPDHIFEDIVKNFFDNSNYLLECYCAPFTSPEWLTYGRNVETTCNYFFLEKDSKAGEPCSDDYELFDDVVSADVISNEINQNCNFVGPPSINMEQSGSQQPTTLSTMCIDVLNKKMLKISNFDEDKFYNIVECRENPKSLIQLCLNYVRTTSPIASKVNNECYLKINMFTNNEVTFQNHMSLKCLKGKTDCCKHLINENEDNKTKNEVLNLEYHLYQSPKSLIQICLNHIAEKPLISNIISSEIDSVSELSDDDQNISNLENYISIPPQNPFKSIVNKVDTLSLICLRSLQNDHLETFSGKFFNNFPKLLSTIAYKKVISLMYPENIQSYSSCSHKMNSLFTTAFNVILKNIYTDNIVFNDGLSMVNIEIDNVNTITQEAFSDGFNAIENPSENTEMYYEEALSNDENFSDDYEDNYLDENHSDQRQWFSEREINDDKSCLIPIIQNVVSTSHEQNDSEVNTEFDTETMSGTTNNTNIILRVKQELIEESHHNTNKDSVSVKPEPTFINDITIKQELNAEGLQYTGVHNNSETLDSFDKFLIANPVARGLIMGSNCPVYSQSDLRIRRQYEPDSDNEVETVPDMDLLIPQASDSHLVEKAKNILMEESSDEHEIVQDKRKSVPKRRGRQKKSNEVFDNKKNLKTYSNSNKNKPSGLNVEVLTKDKIDNEEKNIESTNSVTEVVTDNISLATTNQGLRVTRGSRNKNDIQCSEVDSTQNEITNRNEDIIKKKLKGKKLKDNGIDDTQPSNQDLQLSPVVGDMPIELLECEPLMPIFENFNEEPANDAVLNEKEVNENYEEKDGWHCYKFNTDDNKLYSVCKIPLEKLPDTFIDTSMSFRQNYSGNDDDYDTEIEKLTNLVSLNKQRRTGKEKASGKTHSIDDGLNRVPPGTEKQRIPNGDDGSDHDYDNYDELEPSDDDHPPDDVPPPTTQPALIENAFAKNLLMGENDSDEDQMILQKPMVKIEHGTRKFLAGPKSKKLKDKIPQEGIVLTADKMMKKELDLLHAPVVMKEEVDDKVEIKISPDPKSRRTTRTSRRGHKSSKKGSDDSSSEEEKLWVSTKTKLLKQVEKKVMERSEEDARRAKLIKEFIERRDNLATELKRLPRGRKGRRMSRQLMEREKQLRVLSYELFGEDGSKHALPGKKSQGNCYKGRRNIRKVIDKKSLARSTVLANMEEFERKRRLNFTQNRLRELLGIEEGVSVAVIDNELCLEYDFDDLMPAVTVHPFFTKVMKAHQCEGVKFLWDACFESLQTIESGHPGGGCILAHCMGLGKTLQVLALLHTVLTNPRTGIKRVLVCCPLSTVLNWVDEIHKWLGPVTNQIRVFELSKLKKTYERAYQLEDWYNEGGIFIIGYELFRSLSTIDSLLDNVRPTIVAKIRAALLDPGPDIIVCDEGHLLKNDCSVLAIAMSRVKTKRRIMLTGTPMQNNLREYYCMVNFVKPNLLGTYSEYSNRFENPIMNGQHRDSSEADIKLMKARTHILHKVLEGCLQRQEASVLYPYLPTKHEYTVFIGLTKCQSELYKHYIEKFAGRSKQNILKDFHTLQKIWSHPRVLHNFLVRCKENGGNKPPVKAEKAEDDLATEDLAVEEVKPSDADAQLWLTEHLAAGDVLDALESSNKFVTVFKILDECIQANDKLLLFSTSLYTMDALEYFLKKINKWSLGQEYYRLDGSVPPEIRQNWCRGFNAENNTKTKLFLISTRAGSLGLNMIAANRVILMDTSWNPAHDIQSIFRVYRFGQKKDCFIYRLVALGTMEQKIYERSVTKQAVACRVVDEQQIDRHYNMAELSELYRFDELGEGVAGGVALGVRDVALLRVARDTPAVHAVHEHDSLLRDTSEQQLPEHERAAAWDQFQQEQATKQMQNERSNPKSQVPLKRSFPSHDPNEIPLKVYAGASGAQEPTIKTELPVIEMCESLPNKRTRRGRPANRVNLPVVNIAATTIEDELQTHLYNNIIEALLLQRFFKNEEEITTSNIGNIIKNIIASDRLNNKTEVEIYNRIVSNLIRSVKRNQPSTSKDTEKETIVERISDDIVPKQEIDIEITETVINTHDVILNETQVMPKKKDKKSKNKSRRSAPKDKTDDVVVVLSDDDQDDIVPLASVSSTKSNNENPIIKIKHYSKLQAEIPEKDVIVTPVVNDVVKSEVPSGSADDEPVPLHPDILLKPCFTKIVAHIFQKRNPDLNDDSALLAAEYSVKSALEDITIHKKKLCSGTIYDIATQIIGLPILKQLWDSYKETDAISGDTSMSQYDNTKQSTDLPSTVKKEVDSNSAMEVLTNEVNQLRSGVKSSINKISVIRSDLPPNELVKTLKRIAPRNKTNLREPLQKTPIRVNRETAAAFYSKVNKHNVRIVPIERVDPKTGSAHYVIDDRSIVTTTIKDNKIVIIPTNAKNDVVRPVMSVNEATGKKYVIMPSARPDQTGLQPSILPHMQPVILPHLQPTIVSHASNVVPVKLIRRSDFPEVREEESILPDDDDDVRITSSPGPSVTTQPIIPSVFPDVQEQITVNEGIITAKPKSKNAHVISLDSDDEAAPVPQKTVTKLQTASILPTPPPLHILKRNTAIVSQKQATQPLAKRVDLSTSVAPISLLKKPKGKYTNKPQKQTLVVDVQPDLSSTNTKVWQPAATPPPSKPVESKKVAKKSTTNTLPRLAHSIPVNTTPPAVKEKIPATNKINIVKGKTHTNNKMDAVKGKAPANNKIIDLYSDDDTQSSTSDDGKQVTPPENEDPLDIFKNVVHIQAPVCDYETSAKPQATIVKPNIKTPTTSKLLTTNKPSSFKVKQIPTKTTVPSNAKITKTYAKSTPKSTGKAPTDCKLLGSIDLTNELPPAHFRNITKKPSTSSIGASTPNMTQLKVKPAPSAQQVKPSAPQKAKPSTSKSVTTNMPMKVKQAAPAPAQKGKTNVIIPKVDVTAKRKLGASPDIPVVKKKRPEPMTLADFTLDDLEDIIELE